MSHVYICQRSDLRDRICCWWCWRGGGQSDYAQHINVLLSTGGAKWGLLLGGLPGAVVCHVFLPK